MAKDNKTIVSINECDFGSTGTIARSVLSYCKNYGWNTYFAVFRSKRLYENEYLITGGKVNNFLNRIRCRIDGSDGFHNKKATKRLVKWLDIVEPNLIHLHNLHGRYINIPLLFSYCQKKNIKVVWTLHDCWSFTGRCAHFELCDCYKWKDQCGKCPSRNIYPRSYIFDGSKKQLLLKKEYVKTIAKQLLFVCPSEWLKNYLSESTLSEVKSVVIHNGIDISDPVLKTDKEELIKALGLDNKKRFFYASSGYSQRKGLEFVNRLADELSKDNYAFLVAGIEEKNANKISKNAINVGVIKTRTMMDKFYSISDAFINTTLEDTFPTVNIESLSNGTPVITFNTGGSPETIDSKCGVIVEKGNYEKLKNAVINFDKTAFRYGDCLNKAKSLSKNIMSKEYVAYFEDLLRSSN